MRPWLPSEELRKSGTFPRPRPRTSLLLRTRTPRRQQILQPCIASNAPFARALKSAGLFPRPALRLRTYAQLDVVPSGRTAAADMIEPRMLPCGSSLLLSSVLCLTSAAADGW